MTTHPRFRYLPVLLALTGSIVGYLVGDADGLVFAGVGAFFVGKVTVATARALDGRGFL